LNHTAPERLPLAPRRGAGRDVLVVAALAGLVTIAFWEVLAQGRVFFFRDFALFFYPKRHFAAEALRHGRIPFWNPYGACGEPLLGAYQPAVFYPLAVIYYLFPMPQSFMWFVLFHFLLSGAGAYYMMRAWGARRPAAAFTAFAWAFSPAFVGVADYVSFLTSLSWLPWCLAFARRITTGRAARGFVFLSISFAMAVMAAAPEPVIFIAALLVAYAAWNLVTAWRRRGLAAAWRPAAIIVASIVAGVLLSGVEVVPFLHTLRYSARHEGLSIKDSGKWSASPGDALLLFLPRFRLFADRGGIYWHGQHWLKTVYLGVLAPFLAGWTLLAVRRRRNWFFAAVALLFVLMAGGPNSPLWLLAYKHVPGVALIRYPVKFYLPAAFAVAALAGFAFDDLLVCARRKEVLRPALLVCLIAAAALVFFSGWWVAKRHPQTVARLLGPGDMLGPGQAGPERIAQCYEASQWSLGRSAACLAGGAAALLAAVTLSRLRIPRPYGAIALVIVLFADAAFFGAHLNPLAGPETYTEKPGHLAIVPSGPSETRLFMTPELRKKLLAIRLAEIRNLRDLTGYVSLVKGIRFQSDAEFLHYLARTSAPRFADMGELDAWLNETRSPQFQTDLEYEFFKETFYPNANLLYAVPAIDGFEPMSVKWHDDLLKKVHDGKIPEGRDRVLARMWGAGVVAQAKVETPGFLYLPLEKPGVRAFLTCQITPAETDQAALELVAASDIDTSCSVVLVKPDAETAARFLRALPPQGPSEIASGPGTVRLLSDTGNHSAFEVNASRRALLFVADNYFPNFAARVDGKYAPLWRANYAYRAVPVEPGRHTVEFVWRPYDFYAGLAVSAAAIAWMIAALRFWRNRP